MESLEIQIKRLDLYFTFQLFNGQVYYPELLSSLSLLVLNRSTRKLNTLYIYKVPLQPTNYGRNSPINRIRNWLIYIIFIYLVQL